MNSHIVSLKIILFQIYKNMLLHRKHNTIKIYILFLFLFKGLEDLVIF
jgi:hypothetical protein